MKQAVFFLAALSCVALTLCQGCNTGSDGREVLAKVGEQVLGDLPEEGLSTSEASPENLRFAYACTRGDKQVVVLDGVPGPEFDEIMLPESGLGSGLRFTSDGSHLAYVARRGGKSVAVKDGVAGTEFDRILADSLQFDVHGRLVYVAVTGDMQRVVVDGKAGPGHVQIVGPLAVAPTGRIAFATARGGKARVVVDDKASEEFDEVFDKTLHFGEGGKSLVYVARRDGREFVVQDGKASPPYEEVRKESYSSAPEFRPGGHCLASIVRKGQKWAVVLDGKAGREYDEVEHPLWFSDDGGHMGYSARQGDQWFAVIDGREEGPYDQHSGYVDFTQDGKHVSYSARKGATWHRVTDGRPDKGIANATTCPTYSSDGRRVAYTVTKGEREELIVDGESRGEFDDHSPSMDFTEDGRHFLATLQDKDGNFSVLVDRQLCGPYAWVEYDHLWERTFFSPDGRHWVFVATQDMRHPNYMLTKERDRGPVRMLAGGGRSFVVVDGWAGPVYDAILSAPVLTPDGKLKYLAVRGKTVVRVTSDLPAVGSVAPPSASRVAPAPPPAPKRAGELKGTVVTATLDQPIEKGKNVVWCASFQLAWNELMDFSGGPIQLNAPPPMGNTELLVPAGGD